MDNGNNIKLSYNVGTTLRLPGLNGVCLSWRLSLEKIACLMKASSLTKCVNESSTASLCYKNTISIHHVKNPDGTYNVFVIIPKELIVEWSPVWVTAEFSGTTPDLKCYHNGSASGMLLNLRYICMIRCRTILMTNNRMEGVFFILAFHQSSDQN